MREIIYGIFAEDAANKIFIEYVIPQLVSYFGYEEKIEFKHETDFTDIVAAKSGHYVKEHFVTTTIIGVKKFSLELCFIGLDADDHDHSEYFKEMEEELKDYSIEKNALIFIPVQAIEYWLWYIKIKKDNQNLASTLIIDRTHGRKELKKRVYNRIRPTNKKSNPIVKHLCQNINIDWLRKHSSSFTHFCLQFENYIKNLPE